MRAKIAQGNQIFVKTIIELKFGIKALRAY